MKIRRKDLQQLLKEYDASLTLGKRIGKGTTSDVYELFGSYPAQVLKIMDTRCISQSDRNDQASINERAKMRDYFQNEIRSMKELSDCKYIVPITDSYEFVLDRDNDGRPIDKLARSVFMVKMRRLIPLDDYIEKYGMTEKLVVQMAMDICHALQECEDHGILHRDVKPSNIFVYRRNGKVRFVLGDFGICRRMDRFRGSMLTRCGTPAFIAPEIECKKRISGCFNADIFSLGSTLYYMLSGGSFPNYYFDQGMNEIARIPAVSRNLERIILKSVQFYPQNRYLHANDMYRDLVGIIPDDHKEIIDNTYFLSSKQALLQGDCEKAIQLANAGSTRNAPGCRRLLAYCLYSKYHDEPKIVDSIKQALELLMNEGDPIARYIRATLYNRENETEEYVYHLKKSAEEGCAIARYVYGRHLFFGEKDIVQDREVGENFIIQAAEEGYFPALRFLNKYCSIESGHLKGMLQDNLEGYNDRQKEKEAILKFL